MEEIPVLVTCCFFTVRNCYCWCVCLYFCLYFYFWYYQIQSVFNVYICPIHYSFIIRKNVVHLNSSKQ